MNKKLVLFSVIVVIASFIASLFIMPSEKEILLKEIELAKQEQYCGVVIDKYNDIKNRSFRTLEIKDGPDTIRTFFIRDISGLYEYIIVGDSICKQKGALQVIVKRNSEVSEFEISIPHKE